MPLLWLFVLQPANEYSNSSSYSHSPAQTQRDPSCELKRDPDSLEPDWRLLPEPSQSLSLWGHAGVSCGSTNPVKFPTEFPTEAVGCSQSPWMLWEAGCPTPPGDAGLPLLQRQSLVKAAVEMSASSAGTHKDWDIHGKHAQGCTHPALERLFPVAGHVSVSMCRFPVCAGAQAPREGRNDFSDTIPAPFRM